MSRLGRSMALAAPLAWAVMAPGASQEEGSYTNPLWRGADPWVVRHERTYYHCNASGRSIEVWKSGSMLQRGQRAVVWTAPRDGWNRDQVWAPELHRIGNRWYIYYAASRGTNSTHRMGVLQSATDNPQGIYIDRGQLYTGDDPACQRDCRWAIDGTVMELPGQLYFVWSGWERDLDVQSLYIAKMKDPVAVCGPRARLGANDDFRWERVGEDPRGRGLHEAPAILRRNGRVFIVYSCSGSWQPTYKLGLMWADERDNLLDRASWRKLPRPVFESTADVFGVGHCSFTTSPDGKEDWIAYHSKAVRREGWERQVRMQRFGWTSDNFPDFGRPLPPGQAADAPSGSRSGRGEKMSEGKFELVPG